MGLRLLTALAGLGLSPLLAADQGYRAEVARWRAERAAKLKADDGWLTVVGLFWLKQGENRIGADPASEIALPRGAAPEHAGVITLSGERVRLTVASGVDASVNGKRTASAELRSDAAGKPDVVAIGRLRLLLLSRGGRYAIRLKDNDSVFRKEFTGLRWYPVEESWRIRAKFVAYPAPHKMVFDTPVGVKEEMESPGYATFTRGGQEYRLEAAREGDGLFFVFRDGTSGKTTYGGARFLNTASPRNGTVVLDFNRAVNPPCAFTPYATCPLAPRQNRLTLEIPAGEMKYSEH